MATNTITLTPAELQSGLDRQRWAEGLIQQLPSNHDGRNSWLLNYGVSDEAKKLREGLGIQFDADVRAATTPRRMAFFPPTLEPR